jgi:molybdopterin synthase catalytic subunit
VAEGTFLARLEPDRLQPERELAALPEAGCNGAIVSFVGMVRGEGGAVDRLILDHHPVLTQQSLDEIASEALARFDVIRVHVVHRCGTVSVSEPIVFAAAVSAHRRAAFEAVDYLMDRLKTDAIFWKREEGAGGSQWIEPKEADYADRERW